MEQFDAAAEQYDNTFTNTCVGKAQRDQVWKYVDAHITPTANDILEVNCGTGEDAQRWQEREKNIVATDIAPEMVALCAAKYPTIDFRTLDITRLSSFKEPVDTLFSNFGGLNCLSPEQIRNFLSDAANKLPIGGRMGLVIMGKKCLWDQGYMMFKRQWKKRKRRNTDDPIKVEVDGTLVPTWYYAPPEIEFAAEQNFTCISKHPIGLFVPPSYLAPAFESRPRLFGIVRKLDSVFSFSSLANYADHYLIILERK